MSAATQATTWNSRANQVIKRAERDGTLRKVIISEQYGTEQIQIIVRSAHVSAWRTISVLYTRSAGSGSPGRMIASTWAAFDDRTRGIPNYNTLWIWMDSIRDRDRQVAS